ncbi:hypothetical protein DFP72DRAFT_1170516 [Ephemerocybe angulata]|uniref:Uncharacterized protein n=1 Tax=Ephemerocybe angulata TaxID=980116 RepID=A0A8H6HXA8_9AGAR|nr:hypothetical protein DFP72DRAFT_1170516 [Tulosesus angulatus]
MAFDTAGSSHTASYNHPKVPSASKKSKFKSKSTPIPVTAPVKPTPTSAPLKPTVTPVPVKRTPTPAWVKRTPTPATVKPTPTSVPGVKPTPQNPPKPKKKATPTPEPKLETPPFTSIASLSGLLSITKPTDIPDLVRHLISFAEQSTENSRTVALLARSLDESMRVLHPAPRCKAGADTGPAASAFGAALAKAACERFTTLLAAPPFLLSFLKPEDADRSRWLYRAGTFVADLFAVSLISTTHFAHLLATVLAEDILPSLLSPDAPHHDRFTKRIEILRCMLYGRAKINLSLDREEWFALISKVKEGCKERLQGSEVYKSACETAHDAKVLEAERKLEARAAKKEWEKEKGKHPPVQVQTLLRQALDSKLKDIFNDAHYTSRKEPIPKAKVTSTHSTSFQEPFTEKFRSAHAQKEELESVCKKLDDLITGKVPNCIRVPPPVAEIPDGEWEVFSSEDESCLENEESLSLELGDLFAEMIDQGGDPAPVAHKAPQVSNAIQKPSIKRKREDDGDSEEEQEVGAKDEVEVDDKTWLAERLKKAQQHKNDLRMKKKVKF